MVHVYDMVMPRSMHVVKWTEPNCKLAFKHPAIVTCEQQIAKGRDRVLNSMIHSLENYQNTLGHRDTA